MKQRKMTYIGWVGHDNLGDEALYESNKKIFQPYELIPNGGNLRSKITLFGGGTLHSRWLSSTIANRYNYIYGAGIKNPSFWGFDPLLSKQINRFNFRYVGVRDDASKRLLENFGTNCEVIGDSTLLLEPNECERENNKIAISIGTDGFIWGGDEEHVLRETAKLCRMLKRNGYDPILVPFWKDNVPYVKRTSEITNTPLFKDWRNIQKTLDLIASCRILIGEKLHSIIFSAATHTPFISLEYRPKCQNFAETIGFKEYIIRTDKMTAEKVMILFRRLLNNWNGMHKQLIRNVDILRKRLIKFATIIKNDIDSLPDDKWSPSLLEEIKWTFDKYVFLNITRASSKRFYQKRP